MSRANSMTSSGQCRLAPLIVCILDSCPLYDFIVKVLFRLHSSEYTSYCWNLAFLFLSFYSLKLWFIRVLMLFTLSRILTSDAIHVRYFPLIEHCYSERVLQPTLSAIEAIYFHWSNVYPASLFLIMLEELLITSYLTWVYFFFTDLPIDTLTGHRDRFNAQYRMLVSCNFCAWSVLVFKGYDRISLCSWWGLKSSECCVWLIIIVGKTLLLAVSWKS